MNGRGMMMIFLFCVFLNTYEKYEACSLFTEILPGFSPKEKKTFLLLLHCIIMSQETLRRKESKKKELSSQFHLHNLQFDMYQFLPFLILTFPEEGSLIHFQRSNESLITCKQRRMLFFIFL